MFSSCYCDSDNQW